MYLDRVIIYARVSLLCYSMYKNIQLSGEELEKLELENKILESQAEEQVCTCINCRFFSTSCQYISNFYYFLSIDNIRCKSCRLSKVIMTKYEKISSSTLALYKNLLLSMKMDIIRTWVCSRLLLNL